MSEVSPKIDIVRSKLLFHSHIIYIFVVVYIPPNITRYDLEVFLREFTLLNLNHIGPILNLRDFNIPFFGLNENDIHN